MHANKSITNASFNIPNNHAIQNWKSPLLFIIDFIESRANCHKFWKMASFSNIKMTEMKSSAKVRSDFSFIIIVRWVEPMSPLFGGSFWRMNFFIEDRSLLRVRRKTLILQIIAITVNPFSSCFAQTLIGQNSIAFA